MSGLTPQRVHDLIASAIRPPASWGTIDQLAALADEPEMALIVAGMTAASRGRLGEAGEIAARLLRRAERDRLVGEAIQALSERKSERAIERAGEIAQLREDEDQ